MYLRLIVLKLFYRQAAVLLAKLDCNCNYPIPVSPSIDTPWKSIAGRIAENGIQGNRQEQTLPWLAWDQVSSAAVVMGSTEEG